MPAMIRKQIYLDKATDDLLKRESKARRISQAALIRERLNRDAPATDVAIPTRRCARKSSLTSGRSRTPRHPVLVREER